MDALQELTAAVESAVERSVPLNLKAGGSKAFLGYPVDKSLTDLDLTKHEGIISYYPEELVVRARCGTTLQDLSALLARHNQMLAFEPPEFNGHATIGGAVACGISGASRPYAGSVKDYVLGVGLITGKGSYTEFGGQVMKNVAGYDVSRLVCGAFGMLGVIADVSLKVLPKPRTQQTLCLPMDAASALQTSQKLLRTASTVNGTCYMQGRFYARFAGEHEAVSNQVKKLGGELIDNVFWREHDNQIEPIFTDAGQVWRLSTSPTEPLGDYAYGAIDWGGAQRWLFDPDSNPRDTYKGTGHWTLFRTKHASPHDVFHPLSAVSLQLHRKLKTVFDPKGLFNPSRLYRGL